MTTVRTLRVVFITQEDPFYIAEFFRTFFADPRRDRGIAEITDAWILHTLGERGPLGLLGRMRALYGTVGTARLATRYARRRALALAYERGGLGKPVTVAQNLGAQGIALHHCDDVNAPATLAVMTAASPDVILSISATQKFGPELLRLARRGCFNSHSGDLPRFRGMMPTFWTLYENEPHATVTIHRMDERIDTGAIWRKGQLPIGPEMSLDDVIRETKRLSARMMWDLLEELGKGDVAVHAGDPAGARYYKFPTAEHSRELRRRGRRLL